jgi:hypothetical protein
MVQEGDDMMLHPQLRSERPGLLQGLRTVAGDALIDGDGRHGDVPALGQDVVNEEEGGAAVMPPETATAMCLLWSRSTWSRSSFFTLLSTYSWKWAEQR